MRKKSSTDKETIAAGPIADCDDMDRRSVIKGLAGGLVTASALTAAGPILGQSTMAESAVDITWLPAWQITRLIARQAVTAEEVTAHFLQRIETLDPILHAFRTLDAEGARQQARAADERQRSGKPLGPLHGIPIAVKEHTSVKGLPVINGPGTTVTATSDDIAVERLRKAGAIIFGTTKLPGMGNTPMTGGRDADLSVHPRNPWAPDRVPGSSSAGSAAAVAAAMVPIALGSDGGGSTRLPAAISGIVGVHTAMGRIPYAHYDDPKIMLMITTGPMTRNVRDAAIVMQAIAGPDGRDFIALEQPAPDYVGALGKGVRDMRFAWTDNFGFGSMYATDQTADIEAVTRKAAQGFNKLGASVEITDEVWEDFFIPFIMMNNAYDAVATDGSTPSPQALKQASETRHRNWQRFNKLFESYDVLLSPCAGQLAYTVEEWDAAWNKNGDQYPHNTFAPTYTVYTHMFNWLGWPALSIPCGFIDGLPVGLQLVTRPRNEAALYTAADAFLQAFPRGEQPPVS
jgi:Asp-tRNA(Asn)/Glu-tRNA(Gln) amidotransferase A subunit family amidase